MDTNNYKDSEQYSEFLNNIKNSIGKGNIVFFLGAGFSAPLGYPTAENLSELLCKKYNINNENTQYSLTDVVNNLYGQNIDKTDITKYIYECIKSDNIQINKNPYIILRRIIDLAKKESKIYIFTTNWDDEIDKAFNGISYIITNKDDYNKFLDDNKIIPEKVIIIKLHGDIKNTNNIIITDNQVNNNEKENPQLYNILKGEIGGNSILFIGYSLKDPEIEQIYKTMRPDINNPMDYFVTLDTLENKENEYKLNIIANNDSLNFISELYYRIENKYYFNNIEFKFDSTVNEKIKNNKNIIVVGAKYTGKTMMSIRLANKFKDEGYYLLDFPYYSCNEDLNICNNKIHVNNQKICIFLTDSYLKYFKNKGSLNDIETIEYSVDEDDAGRLYDDVINEYKIKFGVKDIILKFLENNDRKKQIIKYSKYNDDSDKYKLIRFIQKGYTTHIPAIIVDDITYLINEMDKSCKNLNNDDEINNKIKEIYDKWSNKKEKTNNFLALSGLALAETGISLKNPGFLSIFTGTIAPIFSVFPVTLPISLGLIFLGGYFALRNWSNSKNENFIKNLANARIFWGNLNETEKRFISYKIERALDNAEPERVYYALEGVFSNNVSEDDFNKFKDNIFLLFHHHY